MLVNEALTRQRAKKIAKVQKKLKYFATSSPVCLWHGEREMKSGDKTGRTDRDKESMT